LCLGQEGGASDEQEKREGFRETSRLLFIGPKRRKRREYKMKRELFLLKD